MSINVKTIVLEAIAETLRVAKHQAEKQRPIDNISAESICNRFFSQKEEQMSLSNDSNIFWLVAFIECEGDLEDSDEIDVLFEKVKEGFTSGFDRSGSDGQYVFDIV